MKKILCILVTFVLLLSGCGVKGVIKNTETETESHSESETNSVELPSESEKETFDTQQTEKTSEDEDIPEFQITLPEGAVLMGMLYTEQENWIISHEDFVVTEEYPYKGGTELWTQAGWITLWDGEYLGGNGKEPYIPWNHCEMGNYEKIPQGYIAEITFDIYGALDIYEQNIPSEMYTAECWCIAFEDPNGMQETGIHSNWIFLNKKCFTKEEALEIAETFVPVYTE